MMQREMVIEWEEKEGGGGKRGRIAEPAWLGDSQPRMATPLGLEKYGRIDFTLGRWVPTDPKTPKWI